MRDLKVVFTKDGEGWWMVRVPAVPGCHTQGKTIEQGMRRIAEALELFDVDPKRVRLVREYSLPKAAREAVARTAQARRRAEKEQERAQSALREAARKLAAIGVSLRDAGELLGLSHQRVQQLLQADA
ncbi:MAG: type II toxin-antitoxin system HicB family antitoxin [Myxococcales bacterium]